MVVRILLSAVLLSLLAVSLGRIAFASVRGELRLWGDDGSLKRAASPAYFSFRLVLEAFSVAPFVIVGLAHIWQIQELIRLEPSLGALALAGVGAILTSTGIALYRGLSRGSFSNSGSTYTRDESPRPYWGLVVVLTFTILIIAAATIAITLKNVNAPAT